MTCFLRVVKLNTPKELLLRFFHTQECVLSKIAIMIINLSVSLVKIVSMTEIILKR